jgi:hypothetical protein
MHFCWSEAHVFHRFTPPVVKRRIFAERWNDFSTGGEATVGEVVPPPNRNVKFQFIYSISRRAFEGRCHRALSTTHKFKRLRIQSGAVAQMRLVIAVCAHMPPGSSSCFSAAYRMPKHPQSTRSSTPCSSHNNHCTHAYTSTNTKT